MIDTQLLNILCCPETKQTVSLAEDSLIQSINEKIDAGTLKSRDGNLVEEKIDAGLIREDKKALYPVRNEIPIMLVDSAIEL